MAAAGRAFSPDQAAPGIIFKKNSRLPDPREKDNHQFFEMWLYCSLWYFAT